MENIVLLDRNDNTVTHADVERVNLVNSSGKEVIYEPQFRMDSVHYYYAKPMPNGSGGTNYQIVGIAFNSGGTNGNAVIVTAGSCEADGYYNGTDYVMVVIASKKNLTKGNTYTQSEIYYG